MGWGSHLNASLKEGLKPVVDLVYPPRCPLCGGAIAEQGGLCVECWGLLEFPSDPACSTCQRPLGSAISKSGSLCFVCAASPPLHSGITAATLYNDASRQLMLNFKHGGKIALAPLLARLIAARLPDFDVQSPLLVPVPLHRWRLWQRGYNQSALLARELERIGKGELLVDALVRHKRTPSLGGLGREQRERALAGAITAGTGARSRIAGRTVILVDDVLTSGATTDACSQALFDCGANGVHIACFARVVDGAGQGVGQKSETPEVG